MERNFVKKPNIQYNDKEMQNGLQLINSGGSVLVELGLSIIEIYVNQHTQKIALLKFQYELLFMLFYH